MTAFGTTFIVLTIMGGVWLTGIGAVLYAVNAFQHAGGVGKTVADGSILMTLLALALVINVAIAAPGLLMLQPFRLWRVVRNERRAITPRQRFRGRFSPSFFLFVLLLPIFPSPICICFELSEGACCIEVDPVSDQLFILLFF